MIRRAHPALVVAGLMVLTASGAGAQSRGRVAGIARPAEAAAAPAQSQPATGRSSVPIVAAGYIPVIVGGDGQVWADFGWGYEPVMRSCGAWYAPSYQATQPQATQPTTAYTPPPVPTTQATQQVAQPVAAPQAVRVAGIAPAPAEPQQPVRTRAACWTRDAGGRVIVVRQ